VTIEPGHLEAPQLSEWPSGLSGPIEYEDGWLLPHDLAEATNYRLRECVRLPGLAQTAIDATEAAWRDALDAELEAQEFEEAAIRDTYWSPWLVGLVVGAVAAGALVFGVGVGYMVCQ
jgi:hypothetical protein